MPEGVEANECDIIGKDVIRILHRQGKQCAPRGKASRIDQE